MAAGLAIAGGVQALGALSSGESQSEALGYSADVASNNATLALQAGDMNARRQQMLSSQKIGAERAGYGASGIDSGSGSALDVLGSSAMNGELDKLNILHGAQVQAINFENQAAIDRSQADSAKNAGLFGAAGALAGGVGGYMKGSGPTSFSFNNYGSDGEGD